MDDKPTFKNLKLWVTGYGAFGSILENPTTFLVNRIKANKQQIEQILNIDIQSADVLRVTWADAENYVNDIHNTIKKENNPETFHLIIHFGVASHRKQINIECYARNETQGGDVDNIVRSGCIREGHGDGHICRLNTEKIHQNLKSKGQSCDFSLSDDAGTYLCNFIYYCNENLCKKENYENVYCVFIHVPLFEAISEESQYQFFLDFVQEIKNIYIFKQL